MELQSPGKPSRTHGSKERRSLALREIGVSTQEFPPATSRRTGAIDGCKPGKNLFIL